MVLRPPLSGQGTQRRPALEEGLPQETGEAGGHTWSSSPCRQPRGHGGHAPSRPISSIPRVAGWMPALRGHVLGSPAHHETGTGCPTEHGEDNSTDAPRKGRRHSRPEFKSPALTSASEITRRLGTTRSPRATCANDKNRSLQPGRLSVCLSVPAGPQPGRHLSHGGTEKAAEGQATRAGGARPPEHAATKPRPSDSRERVTATHVSMARGFAKSESHKHDHPMTEDTSRHFGLRQAPPSGFTSPGPN